MEAALAAGGEAGPSEDRTGGAATAAAEPTRRSGDGDGGRPRVTVLIPTYNRSRWLRRAIGSVLAQTHHDLELIVADNASTDETPAVVAEFDDPRVVHVRHAENLGMVGNFDWCLERARDSTYARIMTDDDELYPESIETAVRLLDEHPEVGLVHTAFDRVGPADEPILMNANWTRGLTADTIEKGPTFIRKSMRWSTRIDMPTATLRSDAIPECGWVADDFPALDLGLWLRIARGWSVAFVARPLVRSRIQAHGVSAEALGEFSDEGYRQSVEMADKLLDIKDRFVEESGGQLERPERLMRLARRARRRDLISAVRDSTLPERRFGDTVRSLSGVARNDPRILTHRRVYVDLAISVIGGPGLERLKASLRNAPQPQAAALPSPESTDGSR
jgi:glycosyltransferase involved in cell wall biosynthesis